MVARVTAPHYLLMEGELCVVLDLEWNSFNYDTSRNRFWTTHLLFVSCNA